MLPCITIMKSTCTMYNMLRKNTWIIYLAWHYLIIIISATPSTSSTAPWTTSTWTITGRRWSRHTRIALRWNNSGTVAVCRIIFCGWCCRERSCVVSCGCWSSSLLAGHCCGNWGRSSRWQKLLVGDTNRLNGPRNCFNTFRSKIENVLNFNNKKLSERITIKVSLERIVLFVFGLLKLSYRHQNSYNS